MERRLGSKGNAQTSSFRQNEETCSVQRAILNALGPEERIDHHRKCHYRKENGEGQPGNRVPMCIVHVFMFLLRRSVGEHGGLWSDDARGGARAFL